MDTVNTLATLLGTVLLEIHEPLRLSQESKVTLQEGMVVTVEPGIYIPNWAVVELKTISSLQKKAMKLLQNQIGN